MNLPQLTDEFLEYLEIERNLSPLTIRDYRHYLNNFINWSNANLPITSPKQLTIETVRKYRVYLAHLNSPNGNLPLKKVTQNYYVIALRSFLRYLIRKDIAVVAPEKIELGIEKVKQIPGRVDYVNAGQSFQIVVDYATTPDSLKTLFKVFSF